jgi:hypothetical protein
MTRCPHVGTGQWTRQDRLPRPAATAASRAKPRRLLSCLSGILALTAVTLTQGAAPDAGIAKVTIRTDGGTVRVELTAPALTLVGFAGDPGNAAQREDLTLAAENLQSGDALVRFNTQARCLLESAKVDADPRVRQGTADLGASYRFGCAMPGELHSAAIGLFVGFPALRQVHVHYTTAQGQGAAIATPSNPIVNFIPLH